MFNNLFNLYHKNTRKTPKEDFTTEAFAGILRNDEELKLRFCKDFLGLQSENFDIQTQKFYVLEGYPNCFIDLVITGEKDVCFIENKVDSKEGYIQLDRYAMVLDQFKTNNYDTHLVFCTKNDEHKDRTDHNFKQIYWYDIAEFILNNSTIKINLDFYEFLKNNGMSKQYKIESKHLISMENLAETLNTMELIMDEGLKQFNKYFIGGSDFRKNQHLRNQILQHNRYCIALENITESNYSEILFSIQLDGYLNASIYLSRKNQDHDKFLNLIKSKENFISHSTEDHGSWIYYSVHLGEFIGKEDGDKLISKWFMESFGKLQQFIKDDESIQWKVLFAETKN
jgi:hypothetical protein